MTIELTVLRNIKDVRRQLRIQQRMLIAIIIVQVINFFTTILK